MVVDNNQLPLYRDLPALEGLFGTRTSHRWAQTPGQIDTCNLRCIFPSVGPWDIPPIEPTDFEPSMLAEWNNPNGPGGWQTAAETEGALHFFLDDYRFERVWRNPDKALERVMYVGAALTPDFSIYTDTPFPTQLWQTYRQRWCGAWWQLHGVTVIPAVGWAEPNTYDFSFEGLPQESVVAVGIPGVDNAEYRPVFRAGLQEMLKRLKPSKLLTYGALPKECEWLNLPPVKQYPTFWEIRGRVDKQKKELSWDDEVEGRPLSHVGEFPEHDEVAVQEPLLSMADLGLLSPVK